MRRRNIPASAVFGAGGAFDLAYSALALFIRASLRSYSCFAASAFSEAVIFLWCVKP